MAESTLLFYENRLEELESQHRLLLRKNKRIAFLRLFIFIFGIVLIGFATSWGWMAVIVSAVVFITVFILLVKSHFAASAKILHLENLISINRKEISALSGKFSDFDDGAEYADPDHTYSSDLDIFGEGSVFQFINRTATTIGRTRLALWFKHPFIEPEQILGHQDAINELAQDPVWMQEMLASGYEVQEESGNKNEILSWVNDAPEFQHWKFKLYLAVIPLIAVATIVLIVLQIIPPSFELLYLIIPFGILGKHFKKINLKHNRLSKKSAIINKYSRLLAGFEKRNFKAGKLKEIQSGLISSQGLPSTSIKKLAKILNAFDSRLNWLAWILLNGLLLWDIMQMIRLERWQIQSVQSQK